MDILCTANSNGAWKSIVHLTSSQTGAVVPGNRQFSVYKTPWNGYLEVSASDPGPTGYNYIGAYHQPCTIGEWNTYAVKVSEVDSSTLKYVITFDGTSSKEGTYDSSLAYSTGNLYAYVSEDLSDADSETLVRNFLYQTCSDPCAGQADCSTFVDSCEVLPVRNTQKATVSAALNYKARVIEISLIYDL